MENSSIDSAIEPVNTESKIPMILAIAAFVLGGLSFVFAWNTKSNLSRYKDNITKEVNEAAEVAKQAAADARNVGAGSDGIATLQTDFEELKTQIKIAYQELATSQTQIVANAKELNARLAALEGRGGKSSGTAPAAAQPGGNKPASAPAPAASGNKYKVQSGDNPSKIAKKLGISVSALMEANPGLDPKKLQINQELNVPAKK